MTMTVQGAKNVGGVWLPDTEEHLVDMMLRKVHRVVEGVATYQYHKLERAIADVPRSRRRVAVDVGAQVGLWAMWLAREFTFVECFEPLPLHADLLPRNMRRDNYRLHRYALGEREGAVTLGVDAKTTGNTHVINDAAGNVEMRTLDSFGFNDVDFIKIDVEGFELQVVKGATETLRRCRPYMVLEQKGHDALYQKQPRDAALAYCKSLGMVPKWCWSGDWFLAWE